MRIAVDIGGTFTDLTAVDDSGALFHGKRLTTYGDLSDGVFDCIREADVDIASPVQFLHGSTIAINTVIQRRGARTALLTTCRPPPPFSTGRHRRKTGWRRCAASSSRWRLRPGIPASCRTISSGALQTRRKRR